MQILKKDNMKAAICSGYGDSEVIKVIDKDLPKIGKKDLLIKNHFSALTRADAMMRQGEPRFGRLFLGISKPKNPHLGTGFSGEIIDIGEEVRSFKIGDLVFGESGLNFGANAEYLTVNEDAVVVKKPSFLSSELASCVCDGALTTYNFLIQIADLKKGQKILINGANGALGSFAIDLALSMGVNVVATASQKNHDFLQSLAS